MSSPVGRLCSQALVKECLTWAGYTSFHVSDLKYPGKKKKQKNEKIKEKKQNAQETVFHCGDKCKLGRETSCTLLNNI